MEEKVMPIKSNLSFLTYNFFVAKCTFSETGKRGVGYA